MLSPNCSVPPPAELHLFQCAPHSSLTDTGIKLCEHVGIFKEGRDPPVYDVSLDQVCPTESVKL